MSTRSLTQLAGGPDHGPGERRRVWGLLVRGAVLAGVVGVLLLLKPEIVRGTFSSAESMLRVGAVILAWVVFSLVLRRLVGNEWARLAILAVAGTGLLWVTVAPYFVDETVDDAFPLTAAAPGTSEAPATEPGPTTTLPPEEGAAAPPPSIAATTVAPPPPVAAEPVRVSTGQFVGLDGHQGRGEASIYRQPDGSHFVRLEDFEVSNGPGLTLYLVPGRGQERPDGGISLGPLRGNRGSQNFGLPAGTSLSGEYTVLVWCQPFAVPVAGATQQPA